MMVLLLSPITLLLSHAFLFPSSPTTKVVNKHNLVHYAKSNEYNGIDDETVGKQPVENRRSFFRNSILAGSAITTMTVSESAEAAIFQKKTKITDDIPAYNSTNPPYELDEEDGISPMQEGLEKEAFMLKLLPVKSTVFRTLEKDIWMVSLLRANGGEMNTNAWKEVSKRSQAALQYFDSQRLKLEPVFNPDDNTVIQIAKAERGERLNESLREQINAIVKECNTRMATMENIKEEDEEVLANKRKLYLANVLVYQKKALRILAEIGELLVSSFPYNVPKEGKFSYLPRLLGRAKVTFTIRKNTKTASSSSGLMLPNANKNNIDKNVTILADGFAAPITAGNFVDLSARGFYNGLPVKAIKKRLGVKPTLTLAEDNVVAYDIASTIDRLTGEESVVRKTFNKLKSDTDGTEDSVDDGPQGTLLATLPVLGSFNEGFYDPLTAKPRRIPLEVVKKDRISKVYKPSYEKGFSGFVPTESSLSSIVSTGAVLKFNVPGLVAMNHPDKNLNGGSSDFFSLREVDRKPGVVQLLDGSYAPFGYIIEGQDVMEQLEPGDTITATYVNEFGQLNLKKVRGTSFADAMNTEDEEG